MGMCHPVASRPGKRNKPLRERKAQQNIPPLAVPSTPTQALREAWHDYEAEGVVSVMAEWKASFWEEEYDAYADTRTWRHR